MISHISAISLEVLVTRHIDVDVMQTFFCSNIRKHGVEVSMEQRVTHVTFTQVSHVNSTATSYSELKHVIFVHMLNQSDDLGFLERKNEL